MIKPRADIVVILAFVFVGALVAFVAFQSGRFYQYVSDIKYPIQANQQ